ncbi:hypothetical protein ABBQ32_001464 [Trebouxia sp. C0010 RCD-2024]
MLASSPTGTAVLCGARVVPTGLTNVPRVSRASLLSRRSQRRPSVVHAQLGGSGEDTKSAFLSTAFGTETNFKDKGFISAEEEPDEFWKTKAESKGGLAPLKDPIAIVGILGILLPFVILGIAIATGYVDTSPKAALGR